MDGIDMSLLAIDEVKIDLLKQNYNFMMENFDGTKFTVVYLFNSTM